MPQRKRRFLSDEFKAQAVGLVRHGGKGIAQIVKGLDVTEAPARLGQAGRGPPLPRST